MTDPETAAAKPIEAAEIADEVAKLDAGVAAATAELQWHDEPAAFAGTLSRLAWQPAT